MATPKIKQLQRGVYSRHQKGLGGYYFIKWTFLHNGSAKWSTEVISNLTFSPRKRRQDKGMEDLRQEDGWKFIVPIELIKNNTEVNQ